ncbi:CHAT domain-containing protein [Actinopolymorpha alba]|uniref:CHAT domain-containing protein n=1 Tax=Actinopolymorpha alba TaxID=533267 RepID=UPI00036DB309|nr:CHAT domain-containing protein [Actinopolymorpha alba]
MNAVRGTPSDAEASARESHAAGVAATAGGRPDVGGRDLRTGLRLLGWTAGRTGDVQPPARLGSEQDALAARLLISLAHAEAEQGRGSLGFRLLDLAETVVDPPDEGVLLQQRGLLLLRAGRLDEALGYLNRAEPKLAAFGHDVILARTLLNRAALNLYTGRVRVSRQDAAKCADLAGSLSLPLLAGKAAHNAGYCDLLNGDIPAALAGFATAEQLYTQHGPGFLPVLAAAKARALLAAGLATEAGRLLDTAIADFGRQRLGHDVAEAELWRAHAALESGDLAAARLWSATAQRHFRKRGNPAWTAIAGLMRLRAEFPALVLAGRSAATYVQRANQVGANLRQAGLARDAEMADLLAIRALAASGRVDQATARLSSVRRTRAALDTMLMRRITRAELAERSGRRGAAFAEIRAGLAALHVHRGTLGSPDLQVGAASLGRELAFAGLDLALADGSPRLVFAWSERSRAQAFRIPPVRPPEDPELSESLAELRQLRNLMRTAELEGRREPGLLNRCVELERTVREARWRLRGPGASKPVVGTGPVLEELAKSDRLMLCYLVQRGRVYALVVRSTGIRLHGLGDHALAEEATHRLLADLDALAGRRLPERLATVIRGSIQRQLEVLTEHLVAGLRTEIGDADLVVVPTQALSSLPWSLLPDFHGRAVTVSASASAWYSAATAATPPPSRPPLLVAGPDIANAEAEIEQIGKVYPGSLLLSGERATVSATLRAIDGTPTAHLAAHGHHEPESALFSRLDLADGPLMAYDIHGLRRPPRHVTLSACDVGRTTVSAGDEILGFTAALLYGGTSSVVASVARVTHEVAVAVMSTYHRAVASGTSPARALASATAQQPLASFVCFGAG